MLAKIPKGSAAGLKFVVKNTFINVVSEVCLNDTSSGAKTCTARLLEQSPKFILDKSSQGFIGGNISMTLAGDSSNKSALTEVQFHNLVDYVETPMPSPHYMASACTNLSCYPVLFNISPFHLDNPSDDITLGNTESISTETQTSPGISAAGMLSIGSQEHGTVTMEGHPVCQPCAWFHKRGSCQNGINCKFCHLCAPGEIKNRKKHKMALQRCHQTTK